MGDIWNVILCTLDGNVVVSSTNNPKESGRYLCTCVNFWQGKEVARYLQMMQYDSKNNCWHDCGYPSGISHTILAWTDKITPCDFVDFDYMAGGYLMEKKK